MLSFKLLWVCDENSFLLNVSGLVKGLRFSSFNHLKDLCWGSHGSEKWCVCLNGFSPECLPAKETFRNQMFCHKHHVYFRSEWQLCFCPSVQQPFKTIAAIPEHVWIYSMNYYYFFPVEEQVLRTFQHYYTVHLLCLYSSFYTLTASFSEVSDP